MNTEIIKSGQIEMPKFLRVPIILKDIRNEGLTGKFEYMKSRARFSILHISSYYPGLYESDGESNTVTIVIVSGHSFYVDMPIERFDKLIEQCERNFKYQENIVEES